jgi:hypothetical protein
MGHLARFAAQKSRSLSLPRLSRLYEAVDEEKEEDDLRLPSFKIVPIPLMVGAAKHDITFVMDDTFALASPCGAFPLTLRSKSLLTHWAIFADYLLRRTGT